MKPEHIIIAIDGHSSSGKSTFAKAIAREYGLTYIDSGAMYRAVTLYCLQNDLIQENKIDEHTLEKYLPDIRITFQSNPHTGENETYLNDVNVEREIRGFEVSNMVSPVSKIGFVRHAMVALQRKMSENKGVVMDGRDIGSVVFPNADIKIFLSANHDIRVKRRHDELMGKGMDIKIEDVQYNIKDRDHQDSTRDISPLIKPGDAIILDNTDMTVEEQMIWFKEILKQKYDKYPH
ncbi:MAG: (d)CMP kinase [Bacteroidales bacterium]|nr:(d)CMP kinase [Bacteroidales bacterium]